jgi:hypothetical protein
VKISQWQDCAWIGREPFDPAILHRHRENSKPITLEQKFRLNHDARPILRPFFEKQQLPDVVQALVPSAYLIANSSAVDTAAATTLALHRRLSKMSR